MVSRYTIGAMASKKASASSPVTRRIDCASSTEVSGPVATITCPQDAPGSAGTASRRISTSGSASSAAWTASAKPSRSTASAPPAGSLCASPAPRIREPQRRISSCSSPTALWSGSSERNELEQTSSASVPVLCASVSRTGRISCRITGTPARASCQAASLPARPPPITCTVAIMDRTTNAPIARSATWAATIIREAGEGA